jgi:hypothetical protein
MHDSRENFCCLTTISCVGWCRHLPFAFCHVGTGNVGWCTRHAQTGSGKHNPPEHISFLDYISLLVYLYCSDHFVGMAKKFVGMTKGFIFICSIDFLVSVHSFL